MDRLVLSFPHWVRWELRTCQYNVPVLVATSPWSKSVVLSSSECGDNIVIETLTIGDATVFTCDVPASLVLVLDQSPLGPTIPIINNEAIA